MASYFNVIESDVQLTLSVFLLGWSCGMLFMGPISDRFGRKPVIVVGLAIYIVASFFCAQATTIETLIFLRLIQAVGVAACTVVARAAVRDVFAGDDAARALSLMSAFMAVLPAITPIAGGYLHEFFGWQSTFLLMGLIGAILLLFVTTQLTETLPKNRRRSLELFQITTAYGKLLGDRIYIGYSACIAFGVAGSFAFVSSSPFVFQQVFGASASQYGYIYGLVVIGFILGASTGSKFVKQYGVKQLTKIGAILAATSGVASLIISLSGFGNLSTLIAFQVVYYFAIGLVGPLGTAAALDRHGDLAGYASSLLSFLPVAVGSLVGFLAMLVFNDTEIPMLLAIALMGILSALSVIWIANKGEA